MCHGEGYTRATERGEGVEFANLIGLRMWLPLKSFHPACGEELIKETETMKFRRPVMKGPGISIYDNHEHEHIVLENGEDFNIEKTPNFACSDCGNTDKERFRTIKTETADGTEYDLECSVCESLETEESAEMALHRMATKLEKYRDAWEELKLTLVRVLEGGGSYTPHHYLELVTDIEGELKLD